MDLLIDFFQRLYHFEELIRWGGHFILIAIIFSETGIMAGFFLPGDSLLVTAGLFAAAGHLNIYLLNVELMMAAVLGDALSYAIGWKIGPKIFSRENSLFFNKAHLLRTKHFYERYGAKTIVIARFVPIVRTFAPVVAGVGEMKYSKFALYNICGGMGWVFSMLMTGFLLGHVIPNVDKHIHKIIFIVIFISILPALIETIREKRRSRQISA
ncbi:MAG: VTT domain-containing protein [Elusimicrobiota bacterium]|jgi:membrane-associated protein